MNLNKKAKLSGAKHLISHSFSLHSHNRAVGSTQLSLCFGVGSNFQALSKTFPLWLEDVLGDYFDSASLFHVNGTFSFLCPYKPPFHPSPYLCFYIIGLDAMEEFLMVK